jgi:tellurite resistance protein TerC
MPQLSIWIAFHAFVFAMLALDLGVFHRDAHEVSLREAAGWSITWVVLSLSFNYGVYHFMGPQAGLEFLTGYLIEKALSVDNIFVFVLIFSYFGVPPRYQHRILFWGILGALLLRGGMIGAGAYLIREFHWITYVFGAFLVVTGVRMAFHTDRDIEPGANPVIRLVRRIVPVSNRYHGQRFFTREPIGPGGAMRGVATPLFVVLLLVETTDIIFAVDSIPAIFAVTTNTFLVYTSNVFAILGLRAMYFLLAGVIQRFHYLQLGLAVVLSFVGVKMLVAGWHPIPIAFSLAFIAAVLSIAAVTSWLFPKAAEEHAPAHPIPSGSAVAPIEPTPEVAEVEAREPLDPDADAPKPARRAGGQDET